MTSKSVSTRTSVHYLKRFHNSITNKKGVNCATGYRELHIFMPSGCLCTLLTVSVDNTCKNMHFCTKSTKNYGIWKCLNQLKSLNLTEHYM